MADKPDLTPEQLDALEYEYGEEDRDDPLVLALIAMARAKQAAERELALVTKELPAIREAAANIEASSGVLRFALEQAERERDALRETCHYTLGELDADVIRRGACPFCAVAAVEAHRLRCPINWLCAALAQPTDAGGDDEPLLQAEWTPTTRKVRMRLNHLPAEALHPTPLDWPSDDVGGA